MTTRGSNSSGAAPGSFRGGGVDARYDPKNITKIARVREMLALGKFELARLAAVRLAQGAPRDVNVCVLAAECAILAGEASQFGEQALHYLSRACELDPLNPEPLTHMGRTARLLGKKDLSLVALQKAIALAPAWLLPHTELITELLDMGKPIDAREACERALLAMPGDIALTAQLAACDLSRGRGDDALTAMNHAVTAAPMSVGLLGGRALIGNYCAGLSREEAFAHHRAFGKVTECLFDVGAVTDGSSGGGNPMPRAWPTPIGAAREALLQKNPLRVGIVSPDLRRHSVAAFVEALFVHFDSSAISLIVFQTNRVADDVTARLRELATHWHVCDTVTDTELAEVIHSAKIDVLVELSGHTHAHSLGTFALAPAPAQITYLGYPNTTGMSRINARFVDAHTDPDGDEFATERLIRLPGCFLCFTPPKDAPDVEDRPKSRDSAVTFGSFNAIQKLSDACVALWSRVLLANPGSRLVLKANALADERLRGDVVARFVAAGIEPIRVVPLPPKATAREHLAAYSQIDIALDAYPYHGTTTTCEALWMGVPVVSRIGDRHASRVGATLLHAVGLDDLCAYNDEQFVSIATTLTQDTLRRRALSGGGPGSLRAWMAASDLCNGPLFCRRFESAVRSEYVRWCDGLGGV